MMDGRGGLRLQYQVEFGVTGLMDGRVKTAPHDALLGCMLQASQAQIIPPGAVIEGVPQAFNPTEYALIIAPLMVDKQVVGLLEILMDPTRRAAQQKSTLRFVSDLCDLAATYLKNRQMRQMMSQQRLWNQLEGFTHQIHGSLDLKETSYAVVNDGKRLVGCDRLSVALKISGRTMVEAVSGQEVVEQRSNLVRELTRLCKVVIRSGEDLVYTGNTDGFAPDIRDALEMYVDESGSKVVIVTLLHKPEAAEPDADGKENREKVPFGCLVAEQIGDELAPTDMHARTEVVSRHRLDGAVERPGAPQDLLEAGAQGDGLALADVPRPDARQDRRGAGGRAGRWSLIMAFVPCTLTIEGHGSLLPEERHKVYAPPVLGAQGRRGAGRPRRPGQEGGYARQARQPRAGEGAEGLDARRAEGPQPGQLPRRQEDRATTVAVGAGGETDSTRSRPSSPRPRSPPRMPASGSRSSRSRWNR